jgi:hypothetical protein
MSPSPRTGKLQHTRLEGRKQQQQHAHHASMATSRVHRIALSSLSFMLVVLLATLLGLTSAKKVAAPTSHAGATKFALTSPARRVLECGHNLQRNALSNEGYIVI